MSRVCSKFIAMLCAVCITASQGVVASEAIVVGTIEESPQKGITEFQPLVDYLNAQIGIPNHIKFEVVVLGSMSDMRAALLSGVVDFYVDSPLSVAKVCAAEVCDIVLKRWKKGVEKYRSVFFSRKDSGINTEKDLMGKVIAFEEQFSTSSHLLPKVSLFLCCGIELEEKKSNESGYVFSRDDENTMVWVIRRKVDAGAMSERAYLKLAKKRIGDLQIVHSSSEVPRHVVAIRSGVSNVHKEKIQEALSQMHLSQKGKYVLKKFSNTVKFSAISEQEIETIYEIHRAMDFGT